jgi:hypothetical protein
MINVQFLRFIPGAPLFPFLALAGEKKIHNDMSWAAITERKETTERIKATFAAYIFLCQKYGIKKMKMNKVCSTS